MEKTFIFSAIWFPFSKKIANLASQSLWAKEHFFFLPPHPSLSLLFRVLPGLEVQVNCHLALETCPMYSVLVWVIPLSLKDCVAFMHLESDDIYLRSYVYAKVNVVAGGTAKSCLPPKSYTLGLCDLSRSKFRLHFFILKFVEVCFVYKKVHPF